MGERELMTVARVFETNETGVEVIFLESAMFFRLLATTPAFNSKTEILREAAEKGLKVEVVRESAASDVILDVKIAI